MASEGRYMYYDYSYAPPPSYQPPRPIRSDSGSSSSQPPQSPVQQPHSHASQPQYSSHRASLSYPPPPQQQYAPGPAYVSPASSASPQQWTQGSWGQPQQQYTPPPPSADAQQYNSIPPPPARPPSNEQPQRGWSQPSYPPPVPPPPLGYSPPPRRPQSGESQQRVYPPPTAPSPDSPDPRQSHVHIHSHPPPPPHSTYRPQLQSYHPPPHQSPPQQPLSHRGVRRRDSTPASAPPAPIHAAAPQPPTPEPVSYSQYPPPPTNPIDFNKLVNSYHMILEAGKSLAAPRTSPGAVDRMLDNASYAAHILDGASGGPPQVHPYQSRPLSSTTRASPVTVQPPTSVQQHPYSQLQRVHSASTSSSVSDGGRTPATYTHPPPGPPMHSPPVQSTSSSIRAKEVSPREGKAKIKTSSSPAHGKAAAAGLHGQPKESGSDGPPVLAASPSKPKSHQLEDFFPNAPATDISGSGRAKDSGIQTCLGCGATSTPEWRRGPLGPRTLCNACGLVYAKLVKKRMREEARTSGSARPPNSYDSRPGQSQKEETPEAESEDGDEEASYDRPRMPGR